jgi:hypothetical protein
MLFDQQKQPRYGDVMRFLRSLENNGTFPDKWDYMPPTSDPIYPWAVGDPSIIRMSVLFWSLACIYAARNADLPADDPRDALPSYPVIAEKTPGLPTAAARIGAEDACANGADFPYSEPWLWSPVSATRASLAPRIDRTAASGLTLALAPTNGRRAVEARFVLPQDANARLSVFDVSGRRVRTLSVGRLAAGEHRLTWDGRDAAGGTAPSGVYSCGSSPAAWCASARRSSRRSEGRRRYRLQTPSAGPTLSDTAGVSVPVFGKRPSRTTGRSVRRPRRRRSRSDERRSTDWAPPGLRTTRAGQRCLDRADRSACLRCRSAPCAPRRS